MSERRWHWTRERVLATLAVALGAIAVLGDPYGGHVVELDTQELALIVEGEVDHVTAVELADWIVAQRTDYRLIDLRVAEEYAEYHIPSAENVVLSALVDYPLWRNEKIVLYSGGGIHSAQAWFLLRAQGYSGVYMLLGGLDAWIEDVLFPSLPAEGDGETRAQFARRAELSRFFGGEPRGAESEAMGETTPVILPEVEMPAQMPVAAKRKRRKEGC